MEFAQRCGRPLVVAACLVFLAGTAGSDEITEIDGVIHIRNPATPALGRETIRLGHFTRQVSFACPHAGVWDGFFFVGADRVVVVTGHAEAVLAQYGGGNSTYETGEGGSAMEVICYRMAAD